MLWGGADPNTEAGPIQTHPRVSMRIQVDQAILQH